MQPRYLAASACVIGALASAPGASAYVIDAQSASGDYAIAIASGSANNPSRMKVRIKTSPSQHATGNYTIVCSKGMGAGSKDGSYSGYGSFTRRLRFPMRNPDSCTASALGSLDASGRVKVILKAR